jgi:hypothetical protein
VKRKDAKFGGADGAARGGEGRGGRPSFGPCGEGAMKRNEVKSVCTFLHWDPAYFLPVLEIRTGNRTGSVEICVLPRGYHVEQPDDDTYHFCHVSCHVSLNSMSTNQPLTCVIRVRVTVSAYVCAVG